jgi:hypothetical protein
MLIPNQVFYFYLKKKKFFLNFRDTLEWVLRAVSAVVMSVVSIGRLPAEVSFVRWPFFADLSVLHQVSL